MSPRKRIMEGLLGAIWRLVTGSPKTTVAVGAILALLSALYAAFFLGINTDQNSLVSPKVAYFKTYLEHLKNFGDQEYLFVVIETGGTEEGKERAERFSESLAARLGKHPELFRTIYYRISVQDFGDGALFFANPDEAEALSKMVVSLSPFINRWLKERNLAGFLDQTAEILGEPQGNLSGLTPATFDQFFDPFTAFLKDMGQTVAGKLSTATTFGLDGTGTRYTFTSNGKLLIMRILPEKDFGTRDVIGKPLEVVCRALEATRMEFPEVKAGLTGRPALQADEMETSNRDMTRAAIIAFLLVGSLFMIILHGWLRPLLVLISLAMAVAWTFGFGTATIGKLNLLSMVFVLVLVGIGVDFGIHLVMRYVELTKRGHGTDDAVKNAIFRAGPGVILGAVTSVCAFYSVLGSDFLGLAELGQIGGTGVLLALLAMLTVLPCMLLIAGRRHLFPSTASRMAAMPFLERFTNRPGGLLLVMACISLAALPGLFKAHFNYNLLDLQAKGLESVAYEKLLIKASDESTWYAILAADTVDDVKRLTEEVRVLPSVGKVESILDFVPKVQARKSIFFRKAAHTLQGVSSFAPESQNPDPNALVTALGHLSGALENLEERLFAAGATNELAMLDNGLQGVRSTLDVLERDPAKARRLAALEAELSRSLEKGIGQLKRWLTAEPVTQENLPPLIRDIFVGKDGRFQVKIIPSKDVWDFGELKRFVSDLRQVEPEVSGVPVTVLESALLMHRTFLYAAVLTVCLVSLILWLYSRSVVYVLLTLLPLGVGVLWLTELMGWVGLNFNLANFFAIPILIAIGVHGSVHLLARWKELQGKEGLFSTSTPMAVALSFSTTMIGFGGLIFAHHRGLASLGMIMVLGSLTSMLACLFVLPATLKLLGKRFGGQ